MNKRAPSGDLVSVLSVFCSCSCFLLLLTGPACVSTVILTLCEQESTERTEGRSGFRFLLFNFCLSAIIA